MKTTTKASAVATAALAAVLSALPACGDLKNNGLTVENLAYRPDGTLVLLTAAGLYFFDGFLQTQGNYIPLDALGVPPFNAGSSGPAGALDFSLSADGTTAAVSYWSYQNQGKTRIAIYRIPSGDLLSMFDLDGVTIAGASTSDLALSPDGSMLGGIENDGSNQTTTVMLETATGTPLWTKDGPRAQLAWSPDGTTLFSRTQSVDSQSSPPRSLEALEALDARTGDSKWTTDPTDNTINGLSVTSNGALVAAAVSPPDDCPGATQAGDCPPFYPFWSSTDGTEGPQVPAVQHTWLFYVASDGVNFTCNATDTCAAGLNYADPTERVNFMHIYKTDGTVLWNLPTPTGKAINHSAISPDGNFITIANPYDLEGGATVYSIYGHGILGKHLFPIDTF